MEQDNQRGAVRKKGLFGMVPFFECYGARDDAHSNDEEEDMGSDDEDENGY